MPVNDDNARRLAAPRKKSREANPRTGGRRIQLQPEFGLFLTEDMPAATPPTVTVYFCDEDTFRRTLEGYKQSFQPVGPGEEALVAAAARSHCLMDNFDPLVDQLLDSAGELLDAGRLDDDFYETIRTLDRINRMRDSWAKALHTALKRLHEHRDRRRAKAQPMAKRSSRQPKPKPNPLARRPLVQ
ncbi:MAG: hypothetical protein SFV54_03825 [Bryobacteraceae bacterium]|nr:hypothetical protein [Bryobacteraceae bacterium]